MKNIFYSILVLAGACFVVASCSNGAYNANPTSNANQSVDPLNPLTLSQFTWGGGSGAVSGTVNGASWTADTAYFGTDSTGASDVIAYKKNGYSAMYFHLKIYGIGSATLYNMGYHMYDQWGAYLDSSITGGVYSFSYLGNSGEIDIIENDSAFIKAKFYFQGVTADGKVLNVTNGNINVAKLP